MACFCGNNSDGHVNAFYLQLAASLGVKVSRQTAVLTASAHAAECRQAGSGTFASAEPATQMQKRRPRTLYP